MRKRLHNDYYLLFCADYLYFQYCASAILTIHKTGAGLNEIILLL